MRKIIIGIIGICGIAVAALASALLFADGGVDWKKEKFHVIERDDAGVVAISEPHQETKDIKSVFLLIYYTEVSESGTQALVGQIEFNCTLSRAKYGIAYRLGVDTKVLGTLNPKGGGDWVQAMPDSSTGDIFEQVCGHKPQPTQEAAK